MRCTYAMKTALKTALKISLLSLVVFKYSSAQTGSIYFQTAKSDLTKSAKLRSDSLFLANAFYVEDEMTIECHCDNRADSAYNYHLSMSRAASISNYLKNKQVLTHFDLIGHGEENPSHPNTEKERYKNRRCDMYYTHKSATTLLEDKPVESWQQGDLLRIGGLEFVANQAVPNFYSMPKLYTLVNILKRYPDLQIDLHGHVCCSDDSRLSLARAVAVKSFLVANGIDSARLFAQGFSNTRPAVEEVDEISRQQNRRLEIQVRHAVGQAVLTDTVTHSIFTVALREIPFKPRMGSFAHPAEYNLNWLAEMIISSRGYYYELFVYAPNKSLQQKRFRTVQAFFNKQRVPVKKLKIKPGKESAYMNEEVLILEISKS